MKEKIKNQIVFGYRSQSISMLYLARDQAIKGGQYELAREAVKCIDRLVNPFVFYF